MSSLIHQKQITITQTRKVQLIVGALLLLIVALGFNVLLSLNSLEKLYVESTVSQYSALGNDLQRNLETSLRFGKNIEKFVGVEKLLEDTRQTLLTEIGAEVFSDGIGAPFSAADLSVSLALPNGSVLYSTERAFIQAGFPEQVKSLVMITDPGATGGDDKLRYLKYKGSYFVPLLIRDGKKQSVATVLIAFDEKQVLALRTMVRNRMIKIIGLILSGSALVLILLFNLVTVGAGMAYRLLKLRIALVMLLVIGVAQIVFSILNTSTFATYYLQINKQKAHTLTSLLKDDIEFLFKKGIRIEKLVKMDALMGEIVSASPEVSDMRILTRENILLYLATRTGLFDVQKASDAELTQTYRNIPVLDPKYTLRFELQKDGVVEGLLVTNLSKSIMFAKLVQIVLDFATVLIISMLFFGELLILSFVYMEQEISVAEQQATTHYGAIRPAMFLVILSLAIPISFLPLYVETLYEPIFGMSKDMVMGLPISIKVFFTAISIMIAGIWYDRRGWAEPFLGGLLFVAAGNLYAWLAPDALHVIASQGVIGLGRGLILMAAQGFVLTHTTERNKAQGLAQLWAGAYAGTICGSAVGAMLAERLGYRLVFLIGAFIVIFGVAYVFLVMRHAMKRPIPVTTTQTGQTVSFGHVVKFLFHPSILPLLLLSVIPAALLDVGFLNYFSPIYLNRAGVSQSNIGRIFMLNSVSLVYLSPIFSKYIDASAHKKRYILISGIIASVALLPFYWLSGAAITTLAVFLLGISASFGDARDSYMLKQPVTQSLGAGKAMGVYSSVDRIGQTIGPVVFGWCMMTMDLKQTMLALGIGFLCATVLFQALAPREKVQELPDTSPQ